MEVKTTWINQPAIDAASLPAQTRPHMPRLTLKPTHKAVSAYYDSLAKLARLGIKHESAVRSAFQELLEHIMRLIGQVITVSLETIKMVKGLPIL
jgi:hypothetical protein